MDYEANKDKFISSDGKKLTVGLFEETWVRGTAFPPIYKLSDWRKIYVDLADPTEYLPATQLVGDWTHWLLIRNHPRIKPIMDDWLKEVEAKLRSDAVREMMKHSKKEGGTAAAKWIAEGGYVKRDTRKKEDKAMESAIVDEVSKRVSKDAERLGLKIIEGGK